MSKDDNVGTFTKNLPCDDTQQPPFQVVLVDIERASKMEIRCVKRPLRGDLNFIALSYRWGELQETMVDTGLGYIASVTSFDINHFYELCRMMIHESDLKSIKYVWVDAICVDQTNLDKRKATIYRMTEIYEHADYILAVPDLHLRHLNNTSLKNAEIIKHCQEFGKDIYYLIHGNAGPLAATDKEFLDRIGVPKDRASRQWLMRYTDYFTVGLMKYRRHHYRYKSMKALDHLYEIIQASFQSSAPSANDMFLKKKPKLGQMNKDGTINLSFKKKPEPAQMRFLLGGGDENGCFHECNKAECPLDLFDGTRPLVTTLHNEAKNVALFKQPWNEQIVARHTIIQQSLHFFIDLIKDWSTRVWVISEYNIAKKKNNLKYWFIQLEVNSSCFPINPLVERVEHFTFFKFDFVNPAINADHTVTMKRPGLGTITSTPIYQELHHFMIDQLNEQTFLDMMLKSKASKHGDRFHSIFPLFDNYKKKITSRDQVDDWQISTLFSVKLKLYEVLDTKDKLNLLFLSGNYNNFFDKKAILPTFATSAITWDGRVKSNVLDWAGPSCNFDLVSSPTITLFQTNDNDNEDLYYLNVKPIEYHVLTDEYKRKGAIDDFYKSNALFKRLQLDGCNIDIVYIRPIINATFISRRVDVRFTGQDDINWSENMIYLIGCAAKNKWVLCRESYFISMPDPDEWDLCYNNTNDAGFNIY